MTRFVYFDKIVDEQNANGIRPGCMSYDILRESLSVFQKAVKSAKFKFLTEIV